MLTYNIKEAKCNKSSRIVLVIHEREKINKDLSKSMSPVVLKLEMNI